MGPTTLIVGELDGMEVGEFVGLVVGELLDGMEGDSVGAVVRDGD